MIFKYIIDINIRYVTSYLMVLNMHHNKTFTMFLIGVLCISIYSSISIVKPASAPGIIYFEIGDESYMPLNGVLWSVSLNGETQSSTTFEIVFFVGPGVYNYVVTPPAGYTWMAGYPLTGLAEGYEDYFYFIFEDGAAPTSHSVIFSESGLSSGTSWGVTFDGDLQSSTIDTITFSDVADGSYAYSISTPTGYTSGSTLSGTVTVSGADASHSLNFTPQTFSITVTQGSHGTISPGTTTVNYGASQSFTITPDSGYHVVDVSVDGDSVGAISSREFTNVQAAHTLTASFASDIFEITVTQGSHGTIAPGSTVVAYGESQSFTVTADTGYNIVDVVVDGDSKGAVSSWNFTNVQAVHSITAAYAIDTFDITVTQGTHGTIDPGTTGVDYGGSQSFTITADAGYHIVDVVVDGDSQGAITSWDFTDVQAAHTVTAVFAIDTFTLSVTQGAHGTIAPGTTSLDYGGDQSFSVTPDVGYHVVDVVVDGDSEGALSSWDFTDVQATHSITASFAINTYAITVTQSSHGTIAPGTTTVTYGDSQSFTITPSTGYHIVDVTVDGDSKGVVSSWDFNDVQEVHTITASFAIDTFTITVTQGSHGSITPETSTANFGSDNAFTVTPDVNYHIDSITIDSNPVTVDSPSGQTVEFNSLQSSHTLTASFAINVLTITASAGAGGSISPSGSVSVNYDEDQSFTVTPNAGYHIGSVSMDGSPASAPYTFTNVVANGHTIEATFVVDPSVITVDTFTLFVTQGMHGTIAPGTTFVSHGATRSFTITPDTGYHTVDVAVDGASKGPLTSWAFPDIRADHSITASFAVDELAITVTQSAHGAISPDTTFIEPGGSQIFSITPDTGCHIQNVVVDDEPKGATSAWEFTDVQTSHTLTASFAVDECTLTVSVVGDGSVTESSFGPYHYGDSLVLTATAGAGWSFSDWGEDVAGTDNPATLTMNGDKTVTAKFSENAYVVNFTQSGIRSDFSGVVLTIDGTDYPASALPLSFNWDSGSEHAFAYASLLSVIDGKQYSWASTTGLSNLQSGSLTVTGSGTVAGNFNGAVITIIATVTTSGEKYGIKLGGNVAVAQMSNVTITPHQSNTTTTVSFTVTGESGTEGFGNMTIPKAAIPYGTTPIVYIDGQEVLNQGYTQDADNFYVWYSTHFSTHQVTMEFTAIKQPQENVPYTLIGVLVTISAIVVVTALLLKHRKTPSTA